MSWFQRKSAGIKTNRTEQNETPEGYWRKDPNTGEMVSQRVLEENHMVTDSGHHFPLSGLGYCRMLFDDGAFTRFDDDLVSTNPLDFHDRKPYDVRIKAAQEKTGLNDAAVGAFGTVGGHKLSLAAMDFTFIGGSMGSVVGEIVTRAIRRAVEERAALMVISQSGGARMMEGALSLMQMAKTSANLAVLDEMGLPYVSLMTYPTTGGVTASFAMLGDFNIAEPGALIGFAGPRVIRETIGRDLPKGFQSAEFLLDQGFLDDIVPRPKLRRSLIHMLNLLFEEKGNMPDEQEPVSAETAA